MRGSPRKVAQMGSGESKMQKYERDLAEWEEICAAMAAEEAAARFDHTMGPCYKCVYCGQQALGLALELPLRYAWHGACAAGACACTMPCALARKEFAEDESWFDASGAFLYHHNIHMQAYCSLGSFLVENLWLTLLCAPIDLYVQDFSLERPPKPVKPKTASDMCDCGQCCAPKEVKPCCELHCCLTCEQLLLRRVRSMLCVLALGDWRESVHPAACCGPLAPCGCVCEDEGERLVRWTEEEEERRRRRTEHFYERREREPSRYTFSRTMSGTVSAVIQRDVEDAGACCGAFSGSRYGATAVEAQAEPAESDVVYNKMVR